MNREDTKKAIEVMQAFVDGAEIESRQANGHSTWGGSQKTWSWNQFDYRIKPMPREWWLNAHTNECYVTAECAEKFAGIAKIVKVREVIE